MKTPPRALPIFALTLAAVFTFSAYKDKNPTIEAPDVAVTSDTKPAKKILPQTLPYSNALPSANDNTELTNIPADLADRYKAALQANNAKALLELGKQAHTSASSNIAAPGTATAHDFAQFAALCFTQAAHLGNTDAMLLAARCALEGIGADASRQTALNLYIAAGEAGEAAGYNAAARMLLDGKDSSPDVPSALALINKAIQLGSHEAQFLKGTILLAQGDATTEAINLLMEAARADNADAQFLLAKLYREGKYIPHDETAIAEWTKYAADLGLASANTDYAHLTLNGKSGADQDIRVAIDRLIYAAGQGNGDAAMQLSHVFQSAQNPTPEDIEIARRYAKLAYDKEAQGASLMLALIALGSKDPDSALDWLKQGATRKTDWRTEYAYSLATEDGLELVDAIFIATQAQQEDALRRTTEKRAQTNLDSVRPVILSAPEPQIPVSLTSLDAKINARAEFVIDKNGIPMAIKLIIPSPYEELNKSIIETLYKWRFKPGSKNGVPVNTRVQIPVSFYTKR